MSWVCRQTVLCLNLSKTRPTDTLSPFAAGLLITRGRNVMSSYVDDPEATAKVLHPLEGDDGLPW